MIPLLRGGRQGLDVVRAMVERHTAHTPDEHAAALEQGEVLAAGTRLLAPVPNPGLILAVGLNYHSHLKEMAGTPQPAHPSAFLKSPASVSHPNARLHLPAQAPHQVDYEGELAVIFGRACYQVSAGDALDYVAGYTVANDLSARDWVKPVWEARQPWEARLTWEVNIMGKQLPGFTALGPDLLTVEEVPDASAMRLTTILNGNVMQDALVSDMIFPIGEQIAHFSRWYAFQPGDVLLTGTPAGVGVGRKPPVFLREGDSIEIRIEPIGTLTTHCIA